jgi:hypothetical protein
MVNDVVNDKIEVDYDDFEDEELQPVRAKPFLFGAVDNL